MHLFAPGTQLHPCTGHECAAADHLLGDLTFFVDDLSSSTPVKTKSTELLPYCQQSSSAATYRLTTTEAKPSRGASKPQGYRTHRRRMLPECPSEPSDLRHYEFRLWTLPITVSDRDTVFPAPTIIRLCTWTRAHQEQRNEPRGSFVLAGSPANHRSLSPGNHEFTRVRLLWSGRFRYTCTLKLESVTLSVSKGGR